MRVSKLVTYLTFAFALMMPTLALAQTRDTALDIQVVRPCCESKTKKDSTYVNWYVLEGADTVYFTPKAGVFQCDYLVAVEKSHTICQFFAFGKTFTGHVQYRVVEPDKDISSFSGVLKDGFISKGTLVKYFQDGQVQQTGQFQESWKVGMWTTYYTSGQIQFLWKYIKGADYPVVEWEYSSTGDLIYFNDEEATIRNR